MTTGRYLVLANLALSLLFLAWAIGLYTNHINWNTPPSTGGERVQGLVDQLADEIKQLVAARDAADARWYAATNDVLAREMARPTFRRYYADLLRSARTGDVADIQPPVQQLQFQGAALVLRRSGRPPVTIDGQPALSIAGYHKAINDKETEVRQAQGQVTQLIAETEKLTTQVTGFDPPGGGERVAAEQKGLRAVLADRKKLAHELRLEQEFLRSPITNAMVQAQLLRKRQQALQARLGELGKVTAAMAAP